MGLKADNFRKKTTGRKQLRNSRDMPECPSMWGLLKTTTSSQTCISRNAKTKEPPYTERYVRWCERSAGRSPPPTRWKGVVSFCWKRMVVNEEWGFRNEEWWWRRTIRMAPLFFYKQSIYLLTGRTTALSSEPWTLSLTAAMWRICILLDRVIRAGASLGKLYSLRRGWFDENIG